MARGSARGRGRAGRGLAGARACAAGRIGQPVVGRRRRTGSRRARSGRVTRIRAHLVWSPETRIPLQDAGRDGDAADRAARSSWGADESIRRGPPSYAADVRFAIVHHTAGRNDYTRAEAPAIVKGIQLFHVQGNGWNDIGYNFLVDRFGTIYEGRFGGIDRNVVGAHALGLQHRAPSASRCSGRTGARAPSAAAQDAIARLIAWRLDLAHVDPTALPDVHLRRERALRERHPGAPERRLGPPRHGLHGVSRGRAVRAARRDRARGARRSGGLKIFEPKADGERTRRSASARGSRRPQPGRSRSRARPAPRSARGAGTGPTVDWTWDSAGAPAGLVHVDDRGRRPHVRRRASLRAGGGDAAARDRERSSPSPRRSARTATGRPTRRPSTYRISAPANVTVEIADAIGGVVATRRRPRLDASGQHTVERRRRRARRRHLQRRRHGADRGGSLGPEGRPADASTARSVSSRSRRRRSRRTATGARTGSRSPSRSPHPPTCAIRIERDGRWVASPLDRRASSPATQQLRLGRRARVRARCATASTRPSSRRRTGSGTISYGVPFVSDTVAPRVRILPGEGLRVEVSEPAVLTLRHRRTGAPARGAKRRDRPRSRGPAPAASRSRRRLGRGGQRERAGRCASARG